MNFLSALNNSLPHCEIVVYPDMEKLLRKHHLGSAHDCLFMAGSRYLAPLPVAVIRRNAVLLLHYHFVRYPAIRRKASAGQEPTFEGILQSGHPS